MGSTDRPKELPVRIAITAVLTAAALAATGGSALAAPDSSAADKAAITKVLKTVVTGDAKKSCAGYTSALRKAMFGSEQQCELNQEVTTFAFTPKVAVSAISISGHKAKATVTERESNGNAIGTWNLTRSGTAWTVSLVAPDFWRSETSVAYGPKYSSGGTAIDPLDSKAYRACGLKGLLNRSDKKFLSFVYEMRSSRNAVIGKVFNACTSKAPGGKSPFRTTYEADIRQRFADSGPGADKAADCMIGHLRTLISEVALINAQLDIAGTPGYDNILGKKWADAAAACNKEMGYSKSIRAPHTKPGPPIH
jgi:hypothetical protein